jgi:hypothetical protein
VLLVVTFGSLIAVTEVEEYRTIFVTKLTIIDCLIEVYKIIKLVENIVIAA